MKSIFLVVVITFFCFMATSGSGAQVSLADPRFLSEIKIPMPRSCTTDVSNDGHLLYTICDSASEKDGVTPSGQAKLYVHDISDLHNPHQVSVTDVGKISGYGLVVRDHLGFYQETINRGIDIIDLTNPEQATIVGHIKTEWGNGGFRVSDDGHTLVQKLPSREKYAVWDISNPIVPKKIKSNDDAAKLIDTSGKWRSFDSGIIGGLSEKVTIYDIRDHKALIMRPDGVSLLQLYDISVPGKPRLLSTFPGNDGLLIPGTEAFAASEVENGFYTLSLKLAINAVFDAKRLKAAYDYLVSQYASCTDKTKTTSCDDVLSNGIAQLEDAGVSTLLTEQPSEFSPGQRIVILNDWAFWIFKSNPQFLNRLKRSVEILRKVIELDSERSVAWLNLGDALQALIPLELTDKEKAAIWTQATESYAQYKNLSGKKANGAAQLASFNLPETLKSANTSCDYIASAINHGQLASIVSSKGIVEVNGKKLTIVVGWQGGSCASDEIKTEDCKYGDCFEDKSTLQGLYLPESEFGGRGMEIVPFHGKYYIVTDRAEEVIDPSSGPICELKHHYRPALVENHAPKLCAQYLTGKLKTEVQWSELKEDNLNRDQMRISLGQFNETAEVSFDGKQSVQVGHYSVSSGAGCGCDESGIAILDGNQVAPQTNEPNKSLMEYQTKWWRCQGSDTRLVQDGSQTYVDVRGPTVGNGDGRSGALLSYNQNGSFQPICRVDQVLSVTPAKYGHTK